MPAPATVHPAARKHICVEHPGLTASPHPASAVRPAVHHHIAVKGVSVVFCYFLDLLLQAYPDAPAVAVVCDNGSVHHSGITRRWLAAHPRLHLLYGARYSPQDNPTERVWAAMKAWISNTAPATIADRVRQAHAFFRHHTPAQMLTTTAPWTSPWLPDGYGQDIWQPA
jgi:transposase